MISELSEPDLEFSLEEKVKQPSTRIARESLYLLMQLIWLSSIASVIACGYFLSKKEMSTELTSLWDLISSRLGKGFSFFTFVFLVFSWLLPDFILRGSLKGVKEPTRLQKVKAYFIGYVVGIVLTEVVAGLGLVLTLLNGYIYSYYLFGGLALVDLILKVPIKTSIKAKLGEIM